LVEHIGELMGVDSRERIFIVLPPSFVCGKLKTAADIRDGS
jgi:hypothetical protein